MLRLEKVQVSGTMWYAVAVVARAPMGADTPLHASA
jgi:hypothetical protein